MADVEVVNLPVSFAQPDKAAIQAAVEEFGKRQVESNKKWCWQNSIPLDPNWNLSGVTPPAPEAERKLFLERLLAAVNEEYYLTETGEYPMALPADYIELLSLCDGICDIDIRGCGVVGIEGVASHTTAENVKAMAPVYDHVFAVNMHPQNMGGWKVDTGFFAGKGAPYPPGSMTVNRNSVAFYYCGKESYEAGSKTVEPDEKDTEWKWRIFVSEPEKFQFKHDRELVFDGVVDWLGWYGDWYKRETVDFPKWRLERFVNMLEMNHRWFKQQPVNKEIRERFVARQ